MIVEYMTPKSNIYENNDWLSWVPSSVRTNEPRRISRGIWEIMKVWGFWEPTRFILLPENSSVFNRNKEYRKSSGIPGFNSG